MDCRYFKDILTKSNFLIALKIVLLFHYAFKNDSRHSEGNRDF